MSLKIQKLVLPMKTLEKSFEFLVENKMCEPSVYIVNKNKKLGTI